MDYKVILTPRAKQDLADVWLYLRERAPEEASSFCRKLAERAATLRTFPAGYPRLRFKPELHQITSGSYSIVFGINEQKRLVSVYRFWHGAQSPQRFRLRESDAGYGIAPVTQPSL